MCSIDQEEVRVRQGLRGHMSATVISVASVKSSQVASMIKDDIRTFSGPTTSKTELTKKRTQHDEDKLYS